MKARTACFAGSVVSLAGVVAVFAFGGVSSEAFRPTQKALTMSAAEIVSAELQENRPDASLRFLWRKPGSATVAVRLSVGPAEAVEHHWSSLEQNWKEISAALAALQQPVVGSCSDFALRAITAKGITVQWSWCAASETRELKEVREMIEEKAHVEYVEATAHLRGGHDLAGGKQFAAAADSFKKGIQILGNRYLDQSKTVDDTGMKLVLALSKENEGKLDMASAILERVLETRLKLYVAKYHLRS